VRWALANGIGIRSTAAKSDTKASLEASSAGRAFPLPCFEEFASHARATRLLRPNYRFCFSHSEIMMRNSMNVTSAGSSLAASQSAGKSAKNRSYRSKTSLPPGSRLRCDSVASHLRSSPIAFSTFLPCAWISIPARSEINTWNRYCSVSKMRHFLLCCATSP